MPRLTEMRVSAAPVRFLRGVYAVFVMQVLVSVAAVADEDWPMWRYDAARSAASPNALPERLDLLWCKQFPSRTQAWDDPLNLDLMTYDRVFEPIVFDGIMYVGFNDQDKLLALDAKTGNAKWTFYAEAPVRLPPVAWKGKVYFCSDDSYLYCVDAQDGSLQWKFQGAPNSQHALGNQRLTSAWPARGGPVVYDDTVYFAASIWPFMGTFIYALSAETGDVEWVNDSTGAQYIKQPHSAPSFAGVAPQGAMVATEDYLIVPGGRSVPAVFHRRTGELKYFEINAGGKGTGGSFVTADALHYYVHTREKGTRAFNLQTGVKTAFTPNEPVLANERLYSAETVDGKDYVRAYAVDDSDPADRSPLWELEVGGMNELILANSTLIAAKERTIHLIQLPDDGRKPFVRQTVDLDCLAEEETVARLLVAHRQLFVVGDSGTLCALGDAPGKKPSTLEVVASEKPNFAPELRHRAEELLRMSNPEGYAFWYGPADAPLLKALSLDSPFTQLAIVDDDLGRIAAMRKFLDEYSMLGKVSVHHSTAHDFLPPKYVAHSVFVDLDVLSDPSTIRAIYQAVRPYGGRMLVVHKEAVDDLDEIGNAIQALNLEQATLRHETLRLELQDATESDPEWNEAQGLRTSDLLVVERVGALPGSADWTHQYGNIANTVKSDDSRVKLPLGILWFGGSSNMDVLPRHGHGPPEQVIGGRLFIQGMNCLSARDVYTGRVLWKREFEDLGTFDVYFDATYEDTPLNPQYNQVHIPGANGRGTNYVVTEDVVYLLSGATCLMLDPATGKDIGQVELPLNADGSQSEWGYLGIYQDVLIGGFGFANFRERYDLKFESDEQLRRNRAGFGSKSFDRAASRGLVGFDRHTGKELWRVSAKHSFGHNGIVAGNERVYCLDRNPMQIEEAMRRRGLALPDTYRILCFDPRSGHINWEITEGIFGTWLGYSGEQDLLLQAGAQASDRLYSEVGQGMRVYKGFSGEMVWKKDSLQYAGPCILHNDLIITNANSYSESAGAFYLATGKQKLVKHPLTSKYVPWTMTRAYGCNNIIASENLLTFRSGAAGYYDLTTDSGTGNLGGFKSGCTSNLVVANGVLNAPDYTRTCSCSYQNQTSLALVHMPQVEVWSVSALASKSSNLPQSAAETGQVSSVGFNLGASGDRSDENGTLWLEYPSKAGDAPAFSVEFNADAVAYSQHAASRGDDPQGWISASGVDNLKSLRIDLSLKEKTDPRTGIPIAHPTDDAEESSTGEVSLGSSDLELVDDGSNQTVGLRFKGIPISKNNAKLIEAAYLQFTCDETSDEPTTLSIYGELAPNSESFRESSHDLTSRSRTTAEAVWSPEAWGKTGESDEKQRSPDLSQIVREILSQKDWESGNALTFLIQGDGKRVATASRGQNAEATRLILLGDFPVESAESNAKPVRYEVELVFASPRGSKQERVFDISAQGELVATDVRLPPSGETPLPTTKLLLPEVAVANRLELEFHAKVGRAVLSGLRLRRLAE